MATCNLGQVSETESGFSIVVPTLNHAPYIEKTLDSLLVQQFPDLEIIVVDGGSTDGTLDILRRYNDRVRWISEKDEGQADAIRKGFLLARRPWLSWLNSDDVQTNQALFRVQEAIGHNPGTKVFVGQAYYIDKNGEYLRPYPTISVGPDVDVSEELFRKGYLAQPSVFFHRDAYQLVGGINPRLQFVMDYDLWVRLAKKGCPFAGVSHEISGNRWHESTKTASGLLQLYAEAVAVQMREYGRVSSYFVQAISDELYYRFHYQHLGQKKQLFYRTIYFKTVWIWLNMHSPLHCLWGVLTESIAKSGPVVGDKLSLGEMLRLWAQAVWARIGKALWRSTKRL